MKVVLIDNRDQGATWLWNKEETDYVEVDPQDLMGNMLENCYNEDVVFVFERFQVYLGVLDAMAEEEDKDIKSDVSTDHIEGFRDFLTDMIDDAKIHRERALKRAQEDTQ